MGFGRPYAAAEAARARDFCGSVDEVPRGLTVRSTVDSAGVEGWRRQDLGTTGPYPESNSTSRSRQP
jgi:hypothetical protein